MMLLSEYGCSGHIQKQFQGNPQGSWLNPRMYWLILAHAFNVYSELLRKTAEGQKRVTPC